MVHYLAGKRQKALPKHRAIGQQVTQQHHPWTVTTRPADVEERTQAVEPRDLRTGSVRQTKTHVHIPRNPLPTSVRPSFVENQQSLKTIVGGAEVNGQEPAAEVVEVDPPLGLLQGQRTGRAQPAHQMLIPGSVTSSHQRQRCIAVELGVHDNETVVTKASPEVVLVEVFGQCPKA